MALRWGQDYEPFDDRWASTRISFLCLLSYLANFFEGVCLVLVRKLAALHLLLDHLQSSPLSDGLDCRVGNVVPTKLV